LKIRVHIKLEKFDETTLKACCPFGTHEDKTPSFIWNPKENSFHCFSCGRNYGIIDMLMDEGKTFLDAVSWLFEQVNFDYRIQQKID
jgi:DNA primase